MMRRGKVVSDRQRKAMFSKLMFEDDPKELRISKKIAEVLEEPKMTITYRRPEVLVLTGGKAGGSYAHIFTKDLPKESYEFNEGGISYSRSL